MREMNTQIVSHFGKRLKKLIFEKELESVSQFAQKAGICQSEAYALLNRENLPSFARIVMLSDFFSCSADYLLGLAPYRKETFSRSCRQFGEGLQIAIEQNRGTRYLFCLQLGFSESMVAAWYNGKTLPTSKNIVRIVQYLKCSIDSIIGKNSLQNISEQENNEK